MPKQTNEADAIAMLKADHRKVEELFESYESAKRATGRTGSPKRSARN